MIQKKELAKDAFEGISKIIPKIYEDGLQPITKQLRKSLETIGRAVNLVLTPLSILALKGEEIQNKFIMILLIN